MTAVGVKTNIITENKTRTKVDSSASPMKKVLRKAAVTTIGTLTIFAGIAMLVLPGPGMLTILGGISVLGTEYPWAKRLTGFIVTHTKRLWTWTKSKITKNKNQQKDKNPSAS